MKAVECDVKKKKKTDKTPNRRGCYSFFSTSITLNIFRQIITRNRIEFGLVPHQCNFLTLIHSWLLVKVQCLLKVPSWPSIREGRVIQFLEIPCAKTSLCKFWKKNEVHFPFLNQQLINALLLSSIHGGFVAGAILGFLQPPHGCRC